MGNHVFAGFLSNIIERKSKKYEKACVVTISIPSKGNADPRNIDVWFFDTPYKKDASYALSKAALFNNPVILLAKDGATGGYIGFDGPKRFGLVKIPAELREPKAEDVEEFYKSFEKYKDSGGLPPDYTVNHGRLSDLIDLYQIVKKPAEDDELGKKLRSSVLKMYSGEKFGYLGYVASVGKNSPKPERVEIAIDVKINQTDYIKIVFWNENVSKQAEKVVKKGSTVFVYKMTEREPYKGKRQFAAEDFIIINNNGDDEEYETF